jgi:hypothetical protein
MYCQIVLPYPRYDAFEIPVRTIYIDGEDRPIWGHRRLGFFVWHFPIVHNHIVRFNCNHNHQVRFYAEHEDLPPRGNVVYMASEGRMAPRFVFVPDVDRRLIRRY